MTPVAERWMDSIVDNLYGYLGDLKDQLLSEKNWIGRGKMRLILIIVRLI